MEYLAVVEAAKHIRKGLKSRYPGVKFSVRKEHLTIRITYVDGPRENDVQAFGNAFTSSYYDGQMEQTIFTGPVTVNGVEMESLVRHVFVTRYYTAAALQQVADEVARDYGYHVTVVDGQSWDGKWPRARFEGEPAAVDAAWRAAKLRSFVEAAPEPEDEPSPENEAADCPYLDEYKGHDILVLPMDDGKEFRFGRRKAAALHLYMDDIPLYLDAEDENDAGGLKLYKTKYGDLVALVPLEGGAPIRLNQQKAIAAVKWAAWIEAFVNGEPLPDTEPETEPETEPVAEPETEPVSFFINEAEAPVAEQLCLFVGGRDEFGNAGRRNTFEDVPLGPLFS